jgi:hypothetical protein
MNRINKDRLITIVLLLGVLVFVAWLPPDYSIERTLVGGIVIVASLIWLAMK